MNNDPDDARFENDLRAWRPMDVSQRLEDRIAGVLDASPMPLPRPAWWRRLGFVRPTAALGWGLVSPAMAVAVTLAFVHSDAKAPLPSPPSDKAPVITESTPDDSALVVAGQKGQNVQAANVPEGTSDEGVVSDGGQRLVRRVRYRSTDLVQWRNPRTGAEWEVSYPREDVLLVPVNAE